MHPLSNAVAAEASLKGLKIEKVISADRRFWDGRFLVVEDKRCQIIRTKYHVSDPRYPNAVSVPFHLPRTDWPDFVIYVTKRESSPEFYIVPRGDLSKDTAFCPTTLTKYRDNWESLKTTPSPDQLKRRFTILNWQLKEVMKAAHKAGLETMLIRRRKRWPTFFQTRMIVAGRRCSIRSLTRLNSDPNHSRHNYVIVHKSNNEWAEFELYVLPQSPEPTVYIMPYGSINEDTTLSLENERLDFHRNNWGLLSQPSEAVNTIEWKPKIVKPIVWNTRTAKPPKETPLAIHRTLEEAEKRGLTIERPHLESKYQLYIARRCCQVKATVCINGNARLFVPLNPPRSHWADFLIFFVRPDATATDGNFFIVPRTKLSKRTVLSPESSWLSGYADAWHLLG
jgi:hypothetical protein